MTKKLSDIIKPWGLIALLIVPLLSGCAGMEPGTEDDPGQALDAPTEPQADSDAYSEGLQNPEEQDNQDE